jgi:hypothetical protein
MRAFPVSPVPSVAELQGLYGAFAFPERLLQQVWSRREFEDEAAAVTDGRRLRLRHPGRWNHLGGPDFAGARLRLGDAPEMIGDVEVHLRAGDWEAHGHAADPAYDLVCLHVVLFPPSPGQVTRGAGGRIIPTLVLWPLLRRSLEEYAADAAVESLARRPLAAWVEEFARGADGGVESSLVCHARERWRLKVHFARLRVAQLGWDDACHHAALEILGYRFNRAPMLRIAGLHPLPEWAVGKVDPATVWAGQASGWSRQGTRPSNHPRRRLAQYAAWVRRCPTWPVALRDLGPDLVAAASGIGSGTVRARSRLGLIRWRDRLSGVLGGGAVAGSRLDTLICDGALPLLAILREEQLFPWWWHWHAGDLPPRVVAGLRALGGGVLGSPRTQGASQGLLGWLIAREML